MPGFLYFHDSELTTRIESNDREAGEAGVAGGVDDGALHEGRRFEGVFQAGGPVEELSAADDHGSTGVDRHGSHPIGDPSDALGSNTMARIAIGSDHAGFELSRIWPRSSASGHDVLDHGTDSTSRRRLPADLRRRRSRPSDGGGRGGHRPRRERPGRAALGQQGAGRRAALCNDLYTARLARAHNDANVLSMGARVVGVGLAEEILATFLATAFEGGRHARRVAEITDLEADF